MFNNVGGKIKSVTKFFCVLGIIASIIAGLILIVEAYDTERTDAWIIAIIILVGGPLLSWISSLLCYGFGELVENSSIIAGTASTSADAPSNQSDLENG